jgi:hypothetical protein
VRVCGVTPGNSRSRPRESLDTKNMIDIDSADFVGKGLHRVCYVHPENESYCIKVVVSGDYKECQREQKYYRFLESRNISWEMLSKFYGVVKTNLGQGAVFDLIRDYDGNISKTLEYYLTASEKTESHYLELSRAIRILKDYLHQQKIITMTLKSKNILFKRISHEEGRLVIIDNIGNSDLIPICNYSAYLSRKKILRKWTRFENSLLNSYSHNEALHRILSSPRS